jgi:purine-binding chemotaxis protein CheW
MSVFGVDYGHPYLALSVASQTYAVSAATVMEIVAVQQITPLPTMPDCVVGLMNLRGTVIPIVDLGRKLGFGATTFTGRTCAIVVMTRVDNVPTPIGVIADEVLDVVSLPPDAVGPPPAFGSPVDIGYLSGITRIHDRYVLILDFTKILSVEELLAVSREKEGATA